MAGGSRFKTYLKGHDKPLLSIITAVYNGGAFIEKTIQSVIGQQTYNIEYIVIDGGSRDETIDIVKKYEHDIHYWISEPDKGIYDAFNKGWNVASPESFVLYLGAGDLLKILPDERSFKDADVVYGNVMLGETTIFSSKVDFRLKLGNTLHHQALFIKKSLFPFSPFELKYKTYADFDLNQKLLKRKTKFHYDEKFLSYALPGGASKDFQSQESLDIVRKNFGLFYAILAFFYYIAQGVVKKLKV
jgi:glycosyltransferase involved in cell wall biosynthesis